MVEVKAQPSWLRVDSSIESSLPCLIVSSPEEEEEEDDDKAVDPRPAPTDFVVVISIVMTWFD